MTQKSEAQKGNITPEMECVAQNENIDVKKLAKLIDKGLVVIPKNVNGHSKPCGIGEGLTTKINANIGSSSKIDDLELEINKAKLAQEYGADALMDLSTGTDLKLFRKKIMDAQMLVLVRKAKATVRAVKNKRFPVFLLNLFFSKKVPNGS